MSNEKLTDEDLDDLRDLDRRANDGSFWREFKRISMKRRKRAQVPF